MAKIAEDVDKWVEGRMKLFECIIVDTAAQKGERWARKL